MFDYNFGASGFSDVDTTTAQKRPKLIRDIVVGIPGCEVIWSQPTLYTSFKSWELEWRRLNGEIDGEYGPHGDVPDTNLLKLLLLRDAG